VIERGAVKGAPARRARPATRGHAPPSEEIAAYLSGSQYEWARELALAMAGLDCTVSDVIGLALDELRDRHPSAKKLEAALRRHLWQERQGGGSEAHGVRVPLRSRPAEPSRASRRPVPRRVEREVVRVLLVHGQPALRAGLGRMLAGEDGIEVVGELGDVRSAQGLLRGGRADVVLMDLPGSEGDLASAVGALLAARPEAAVVVLSDAGDRGRVLAALEAGAAGYLHPEAGAGELARAVRAAARGESAETLRAVLALVGEVPGHPSEPAELTRRERQVLALVGGGLANKQIARRLGISEKTVKAHLGRAFQRIGVSDRTRAALWAERNGLLAE
jgi:DNA-binding NarL/FixJ family response regulator